MKRQSTFRAGFAGVLVGALLMSACAQIPRSTVPETRFSTLSCQELAHQSQAAVSTQAAADQAKRASWYAILPFVVVARYVHASSAANEAERRIALLDAQAARAGCVPPSGGDART